MALRSHNSPSPVSTSDDLPSTSISPPLLPNCLTPLSMARAPSSEPPVAESSRAIYRTAVDLPRTAVATKGGCWTCRLRRKKCDEQRQDDSCHTCLRLKIKCLGWGSKRPEWMRDKQAVEAYKADIKSQLTRAGLIRGQPRMPSLPSPPTPPVVPSHGRPHQQHYQPIPAAAGPGPSTLAHLESESSTINYSSSFLDSVQAQINGRNAGINPASTSNNPIIPMIPGGPSSNPQRVPVTGYRDNSLNTLNTLNTAQLYPYVPTHSSTQPISSATTPLSATSDHVHFDFSHVSTTHQSDTGGASSSSSSSAPATAGGQAGSTTAGQFHFDLRASSPMQGLVPLAAQTSMQGNHVLYYFEHVRRLQYAFAGNSVTNVTYSMILQEPQGAVTNAVCALANLHYKRMRIARGLEPPETSPDHSLSKYFHDEAYFQLVSAKQLRGRYNENDAIAALHLISFSLLSGGMTDWRPVLTVALDWLGQTGLVADENPRLAMLNMSFASQVAFKIVLWLDVFSSLTLMRPPKYLALYRRLLAGGTSNGNGGSGAGGYWAGSELTDDDRFDMRMEYLSGCPDEVMLAIAEVSALAHWKETEYCNGSLSVRELVRRGDEIERQLLRRGQQQQQRHSELVGFTEADRTPLHPSLPQALEESGHAMLPYVDEEIRKSAGNIYRETVLLYLHTVLNDSYPGVPEISESVRTVMQLLNQLPPSEVDRSLVFPICLTGCMTDDMTRRDALKARLQGQDQNIGNLLQTRAVMESVWQKRDAHGSMIDWRETMRDHNLNLLLV